MTAVKRRIRVDFPAPSGPTSPKSSPLWTSRVILSSALAPANSFVRDSHLITGVSFTYHLRMILTSAGMPGLSSWFLFLTVTLTPKTSLTRSSSVWTFFGVNSASEEMNVTVPS